MMQTTPENSNVRGIMLELWGGHECTVNRVGQGYLDQSLVSGHAARAGDIDLFASLGLRKLRYPVLWEKVAPDHPERRDWSSSDGALARIRETGMQPILGLIHHGSGPRYTNLLAPDFATGLARHARATAERYPWVEDWTPVNEPLTTARFSALYGHWFPHLRDEASFWGALLNQVDATRLSMRAIREVNPAARLIQTEDLGRTYSTARCAPQAEFYNQRRWASWDLLCGRLIPGHPLWAMLERLGFAQRLNDIAEDPCPPDMLGINHYLTSDRFLDHRLDRYPAHTHGGTPTAWFADVEAVRVVAPRTSGLETALRETWERYRLPMAVTEVHNGCTREEQMRWMVDAWTTADTLRREEVDVRAITAWSLLGSYDWNSLLTRRDQHYECGVFDMRGGTPRPTAMVPLLRSLSGGETPSHPVLDRPGWWQRKDRLHYPSYRVAANGSARPARSPAGRPLVITGATGTLGRAFAAACKLRDIPYVLTDRTRLALDDPASIRRLLDQVRPWAVINTAGWVRVDEAEHQPEACLRANRDGSLAIAGQCAERDIAYTTFSSDLVFDGVSERSYIEGDATAPLNVYGRSKAEADRILLSWTAPVLVIRTAAFFSPHDPHNFAMHLLRSLREGRSFAAAEDCSISPTLVSDLVRVTLDLLIDGETGLWHLVNEGSATWAEFGRAVARATGLRPALVEPRPAAEMGWIARRPARVHMRSTRGPIMPSLDDALARFAKDVRL
jgi:dTDP-4-dehydrorhamnose reductase